MMPGSQTGFGIRTEAEYKKYTKQLDTKPLFVIIVYFFVFLGIFAKVIFGIFIVFCLRADSRACLGNWTSQTCQRESL